MNAYQIPATNYSYSIAPGAYSNYIPPQSPPGAMSFSTPVDILPAQNSNNLRRHSSEKMPEINDNNFVLEAPVPDILLQKCKFRDETEFTYLRYTACTTDPDSFSSQNYALRQQIANRLIEIFVVVTMYEN
jgi:hypothetical protein